VDDEPHVLAVAKTILDSQTFDVTTCDSGAKAIELVRQGLNEDQRFSVIILDLTMPSGMSGFEVLEGILSIDPDVAVIACSGYFQDDATALCQAIGFADVLNKPYALEHLCTMVRRHLARERTTNDLLV
jgi:CheY-like chemotaxis protein